MTHHIRIGMKVRSIYEPERVFSLDRSKQPERLYHEKGTQNWHTKSALQPSNAPKYAVSAKRKKVALERRTEAIAGLPGELGNKTKPVYRRTCLFDGVEFETINKAKKFHTDACRAAYARALYPIPASTVARLKKEGRYGEIR